MKNYKKITIFIISLTLFSLFLSIQNYNIKKIIADAEDKVNISEESNDKNMKKFGFTEIFESLSDKRNLKINDINSKNNGKEVTALFTVTGDLNTVKDILEEIKHRENYNRVNSIKIEKFNVKDINAKVNIDFIKNN